MKRLLITGSRTWPDEAKVAYEMGRAIGELSQDGEPVTVVHGGASGADMMADQIAREYGYPRDLWLAYWRPYGIYNPAAGRQRNLRMVDAGADLCLAFIHNGSHGASHCAQAAEDAGIPIRIFRMHT